MALGTLRDHPLVAPVTHIYRDTQDKPPTQSSSNFKARAGKLSCMNALTQTL